MLIKGKEHKFVIYNGKVTPPEWVFRKFKPKPTSWLTFSAALYSPFTIATNTSTKTWNGALEYSTDKETWNEWDGTTAIASAEHENKHRLYMRGIGNTRITGSSFVGTTDDTFATYRWVIDGFTVECSGNIENLLDYETVAKGEHPVMADGCFDSMFYGCSSLRSAPELPAVTLTPYCYNHMFMKCTNIRTAPQLPATVLTKHCYTNMFDQCLNITVAPELPATTLADSCYSSMFNKCSRLTTAPKLPASILSARCYGGMFFECTSLVTAPKLPATTLAEGCYQSMFSHCTSLVTIPELPATTLAENCYYFMFSDCTGIKLSATLTDEYHVPYRVPTSGTGTAAPYAVESMFKGTGGTFKGTPEINTTYYTANEVV